MWGGSEGDWCPELVPRLKGWYCRWYWCRARSTASSERTGFSLWTLATEQRNSSSWSLYRCVFSWKVFTHWDMLSSARDPSQLRYGMKPARAHGNHSLSEGLEPAPPPQDLSPPPGISSLANNGAFFPKAINTGNVVVSTTPSQGHEK